MTRFSTPTTRRSPAADDGPWFKSTYSTGTATCVEVHVHRGGDRVSLRDSKFVPSHRFHRQPTIEVAAAHWPQLLREVSGRAPIGTNPAVAIRTGLDGGTSVRCRTTGTTLWFSAPEWRAFTRGVIAGEFSLQLAA